MSLIRNPILEALPRSFSYVPHVTTEDTEAEEGLPSEVKQLFQRVGFFDIWLILVSGRIMLSHCIGPKTRTEIYHAISTNPRMPIKIEMMENMGLLKTMDDGRGRKMVSLTSTGVKFATELCSLEKLIGGNVDGFKWGIVMTKLEEFDGAEA